MPTSASKTPPNLPLALTMGDPAGIGPEITLFAWLRRHRSAVPPFAVLARRALFETLQQRLGLDVPVVSVASMAEVTTLFDAVLPVWELPDAVSVEPGRPTQTAAPMIIRSIEQAVELVQQGHAGGVVTNPINKHVLYEAGFRFPGHTEFLASLAGTGGMAVPRPVMMLASDDLRTVPLTIHEPLARVPGLITASLIDETVRILNADLHRLFAIERPRIAVAGLNPHAGESGSIGREEIDVIGPVLAKLRGDGIAVSGPHPADTLFHADARKEYDVVLGMYHDQALIPLKMLAFDKGVNVTLGLPFIRTSPDHGTAYDIAGRGTASPSSLIEALKMAQRMAQTATLSGA